MLGGPGEAKKEASVFCSKCGKEHIGEVRYCSNCGADLGSPSFAPVAAPSQQSKSATGFVIASAICAAVALLFLPPVFGIAGIVLGYFAFRRNRTAGTICMIISAICMVAGVMLAIWAWSVL